MNKISTLKEFKFKKEFNSSFDEFLPIWRNYWEAIDIGVSLLNQISTALLLAQCAIIQANKFKMLDKKCKKMLKEWLEYLIKQL